MTWHFLDKILDEASKQSTLIGKVWVVVIFIFRIVILSKIGEPLYADEQAAFKCNTRQPGCENVCFNLFSPISHPRFWGLQILFSAVPSMVYIIYAAHIASKFPFLQKPKKSKKRRRKKRSKMFETNQEKLQYIEQETLKERPHSSLKIKKPSKNYFKSAIEVPKPKKVQMYSNNEKTHCANTLQALLRKKPCFNERFSRMANLPHYNKQLRDYSAKTEMKKNDLFVERHLSRNIRRNYPRFTSITLKTREVGERLERRERSFVSDCRNIATKTRSLRSGNRPLARKLGNIKRQNIIMECVRLSEVSSGKIMQTNSINSEYRVTQSFGKRTISFASTSRYSDLTQRPFAHKSYFFGPIETSSPMHPSMFTVNEKKRVKTVIHSKNNLLLASPLPSSIVADTLSAKKTANSKIEAKMNDSKQNFISSRSISNDLEIKKIEKKIENAYFVQSVLRLLVEGGFLLLQYLFFDFNVPNVFRCEKRPCPNTVDCFISRPQEKTIMLWFMFSVTICCVTLSIYELFIMIRRICWRVFKDKTLSNIDHQARMEIASRKAKQRWWSRRPDNFLRLRSITLIAKEEEEALSASTLSTSSSEEDEDDSDKSIDSKAVSSIYDNDQSFEVGSFNDGADDFDQQMQEDIGQNNHDQSMDSY